jgi:putative transcriptional regulator
MTIQGASDYVRAMAREGLVHVVGGEYRATVKGVEYLHENFQALREFVDLSAKDVSIIDITAAVAGATVARGDPVGLFMEKGELVAFPRRASPSRGIAVHAAARGEDLGVRGLEGIVRLRPGRISIRRIPSIREGGTRHLGGARKLSTSGGVVAVTDAVSTVAARKLGLPVDIRYAPVAASIEAAQRGLDVLLLCSEEGVADAVAAIEDANAGLQEKIPYAISGVGRD